MSNVLVTEIIDDLEILPLNLQNHVLAIVRALSQPFKDGQRQNHPRLNVDNQLRKLEEQHRRGYELYPVELNEFSIWDSNHLALDIASRSNS